jgi:RNA recognition motif-containing protein
VNKNSVDFDLFLEREFLTDSVYVGQLPESIQESDLKKLFPKANKVQLTEAVGERPG